MRLMTKHLFHLFWTRVFDSPQGTAMRVACDSQDGCRRIVAINWSQAGLAVASIMAQLRGAGVGKGDRVAILGWNCPEWVWADFAIQTLGGIVVPIYPNNSGEQIAAILKDAGATVAITADGEQRKKVAGMPGVNLLIIGGSAERALHHHFLHEGGDREKLGGWPGAEAELRFVLGSLQRIWSGLGGSDCDFAGLTADDLATIIYTSGSSGVPKGCMISHGNISSLLTALRAAGFQRTAQDTYLSYLPLAHVYERFNGMAVAIDNNTPVSFSSIEEVRKGFGIYKPTMVCGVPAVWRKIKAGVDEPEDQPLKLLHKLGLWQPLLRWAFSRKQGTWQHRFVDSRIFARIRAKLGGRLDLLVSGGAPINPDVLSFFESLGLQLLEGYGLSETTGGIFINRPDSKKIGSVGQILPGCEVRIVPEEGEDEGYGEIYLRGGQIFKGYWNKPEETAAALTEDGWFKTGDLGRLDDEGFLFIIGRKDGMYKTDGGKYVAKEKVEKAFELSPIVAYVVPVAQGRKFTTALVFVNQVQAGKLAGEVPAGVDPAFFFSEHQAVRAAVEAAVKAANAKLERWEQVKKYRVMPVEAQVNNALLTPTLKIRTKEAFKRFKSEIEALYAQSA